MLNSITDDGLNFETCQGTEDYMLSFYESVQRGRLHVCHEVQQGEKSKTRTIIISFWNSPQQTLNKNKKDNVQPWLFTLSWRRMDDDAAVRSSIRVWIWEKQKQWYVHGQEHVFVSIIGRSLKLLRGNTAIMCSGGDLFSRSRLPEVL